jgi:transcription elongation factor Elf1
LPNSARREVIPVEKRKEYDEGDIMTCPKCDSIDVDYDEAPGHAKCNSCGQEFSIKTVVIWEE